MNEETRGCCEGLEILTPLSAANRPGLDALNYRVGTHAAFLETMKARLSSGDFPALAELRTRDSSDPAIALLDAWATVADVLAFYQERIANEGYLRTATERRSVLELARLVGYALRPGVAATVYPAFTMEKDYNEGSEVPKGTRIQSVPDPGEMPQFFETAEKIEARANWNELKPRLTRPHYITPDKAQTDKLSQLYFQGISTNLKPNDALLLVFDDGTGDQVFRQVQAVESQAREDRTRVAIQKIPVGTPALISTSVGAGEIPQTKISPSALENHKRSAFAKLDPDLIKDLKKLPSRPPTNASRLGLKSTEAYQAGSDIAPQVLRALNPLLKETLYRAFVSTPVTGNSELQDIYTFRVKAAPFGANAPPKPVYDNRGAVQGTTEWAIAGTTTHSVKLLVSLTGDTNSGLLSPFPEISPICSRIKCCLLRISGLSKRIEYESSTERQRLGAATITPRFQGSALLSIEQDAITINSAVLPLDESHFNCEVALGQKNVRVAITNISIPRIRFIHAWQDVEGVDIAISDRPVATAVPRFGATDYLSIQEDELIQIAKQGEPQSVLSLNLNACNDSANNPCTIITTGTSGAPEVYLFNETRSRAQSLTVEGQTVNHSISDGEKDNLEPLASGEARVRVLNASSIQISSVTLSELAKPLVENLDSVWSSDYSNISAGTYTVTVTLDDGEELLEKAILKSETVYDIVLFDKDSSSRELTILDTPSLLPGELCRAVFKFLESQKEFRFIGGSAGFIAQLDNESVLTSRFAPNQTLRMTSDGSIVAIESEQNALSANFKISEESPTSLSPEQRKILPLETQFEQILPESWVAIQRPDEPELITKVKKVETIAKAGYGISAKVTQLTLADPWLAATDRTLVLLRRTTIYAQSEKLALAEEAIDLAKEEEFIQGPEIELDSLYQDLQPGRWAIVSGERADLGESITGVKASELVMLAGVTQGVAKVKDASGEEDDLPGDKTHTFLQLAKPLEYQYKRDTVTIYGNVVKATHGETRTEVLGSGDGSQEFQQFTLRQPPLTYVAAPTPAGAASTLEVRVNDVLWHEADTLAGLEPTERAYIAKTDDDSKTAVIFGNGENGARPPTGVENIKAVYRSGIGKAGNVKAEQISLLATRPLGLKGVINPRPATGGADRESRDRARQNAPLAVMSLDRLVSVQDYADFARTFAGIAKASAVELSDGRRQVVHLTIAGADDIPIDRNSELYRNLVQALRKLGDPSQPIQVAPRELMVLAIGANVKVLPDYQWESVEPEIRKALLDQFSFERRELGQDVFLSEAIGIIQQISGVAYADVDVFNSVSETEAVDPVALEKKLNEWAGIPADGQQNGTPPPASEEPSNPLDTGRITVNLARMEEQLIQPAQLALLSPALPLTLILNPVEV